MSWRLAPCLGVLRDEANAAWPGRNKASDGALGDTAHSNRTSDHNPDRNGWVDALDLTHDPASGADMHQVVGRIVAQRDRRISYIIFDAQIWRSYKSSSGHPQPWTPEPYTGANKHHTHAHFSAADAHRHETNPWRITRNGDFMASLSEAEQREILEAARSLKAGNPVPTPGENDQGWVRGMVQNTNALAAAILAAVKGLDDDLEAIAEQIAERSSAQSGGTSITKSDVKAAVKEVFAAASNA